MDTEEVMPDGLSEVLLKTQAFLESPEEVSGSLKPTGSSKSSWWYDRSPGTKSLQKGYVKRNL